jgi:hypothetical protein
MVKSVTWNGRDTFPTGVTELTYFEKSLSGS